MIPTRSVFLLELRGQFLDVLGWPARNIHAEPQAHAGENFLDLVERLAAEVGRAQHLGLGLLNQIADVDDVVVLQAIGRTRSDEHTSELQSLMRISYAVFCLKKKNTKIRIQYPV